MQYLLLRKVISYKKFVRCPGPDALFRASVIVAFKTCHILGSVLLNKRKPSFPRYTLQDGKSDGNAVVQLTFKPSSENQRAA